jgi:hypothetical protein
MRRSQEEAERMLSGLHSKRDALIAELEGMRERLLSMAKALGAIAAPTSEPEPIPASRPSAPVIAPAAPMSPAPPAPVTPPAPPSPVSPAMPAAPVASAPVSAPAPPPPSASPDLAFGEDDGEAKRRRRPVLGPIDPSLLDDPQFADLWSQSEANDLVIPEISAADLWSEEDPDAPPIP